MEKLPPRYKAKCKQCGKKLKPSYPDKKKGKWVYICKDCCGFKYTKGDKRTIKEKYDKEVLVFINKLFIKKSMSWEHNDRIIANRILKSEESFTSEKEKADKVIKKIKKSKRKSTKWKKYHYNLNLRSYPFGYIHQLTKKEFPNKKVPSVYSIGHLHRKWYGKRPKIYSHYFKRNSYTERDSFT